MMGRQRGRQGSSSPRREPGLCWKQLPPGWFVLIFGLGLRGHPGERLLTPWLPRPERSAEQEPSSPSWREARAEGKNSTAALPGARLRGQGFPEQGGARGCRGCGACPSPPALRARELQLLGSSRTQGWRPSSRGCQRQPLPRQPEHTTGWEGDPDWAAL